MFNKNIGCEKPSGTILSNPNMMPISRSLSASRFPNASTSTPYHPILCRSFRNTAHVRLPDRIVVVDPRNRRIVFVIDEGRDGREGRANFDSRARFALSPEQKRAIHSEIVRDYQGDHNPNFEVRLGERVPEAIDLEPVPEDVYADIPDMEPYRYFVIGNAVVIVEPRTREIVDLID
jgi:hypothetical protein